MQHLNHVTRRGAVYIWRRRLPVGCRIDGDTIQVSLRTRRFSTAKILANLVNRAFCDSILRVKSGKITRAEAQQFLSSIVSAELRRIEDLRYAEPQASTPAEWRERYLEERARAAALRKIAAMGPAAHLMEEDRAELSRQGHAPEHADRIEDQIEALLPSCGRSFVNDTAVIAQDALGRDDFSDEDRRVLSQIRLTGQAEALTRSDRMENATPFIGLSIDEGATHPIEPAHPTEVTTAEPLKPARQRYSDRLLALHEAYIEEKFKPVEDAGEQKKINKARRQNGSVLLQWIDAMGLSALSEVEQQDMHYYVSILERMPKNYGKSEADRKLTLDELIERAEELPPEEVGLSSNTVNRNLTIIGNFLKFARSRGAHPAEALYLTDLRQKISDDERSARLAFSDDDVRELAKHPFWSGCLSEKRRNLSGNLRIKDGLFWAPILAAASGARREEIMGLALEDIITDHEIPHIAIRPNAARRLKNASSCRVVPIHSRLIELGFLDYVREMRSQSHEDLFPELRPDNPNDSYGSVFYKPWKAAVDMQLQGASKRKTFHSFRHRVITVLRHMPEVDKAWVKDLVGHKHSDETDGRYRDATPLAQLQAIVEKIPVIF